MNPSILAVLVALLGAASLSAQSIPAASAPVAQAGDPIVLSPFQVGSDTERGYQSTAILQGGRGRIDLADVAGQVQVFTKDFLDDIAANTTDEAFSSRRPRRLILTT